jgi:hypothetical protein
MKVTEMSRPAAVLQHHVADAIARVRRDGGQVQFIGSRLRGLTEIREFCGGETSRVRAFALLHLCEQERQAIPAWEVRAARLRVMSNESQRPPRPAPPCPPELNRIITGIEAGLVSGLASGFASINQLGLGNGTQLNELVSALHKLTGAGIAPMAAAPAPAPTRDRAEVRREAPSPVATDGAADPPQPGWSQHGTLDALRKRQEARTAQASGVEVDPYDPGNHFPGPASGRA